MESTTLIGVRIVGLMSMIIKKAIEMEEKENNDPLQNEASMALVTKRRGVRDAQWQLSPCYCRRNISPWCTRMARE